MVDGSEQHAKILVLVYNYTVVISQEQLLALTRPTQAASHAADSDCDANSIKKLMPFSPTCEVANGNILSSTRPQSAKHTKEVSETYG